MMVWSSTSSLHSLSRRSFNSVTSWICDFLLLKDTPDAVVHRTQIWRIGWPHLLASPLQHGDSVTCTVNGMIPVTSTLHHQVCYVTSMISRPIHLQSCVSFTKNHKNPCIFVKVIVKTSVAPFYVDMVYSPRLVTIDYWRYIHRVQEKRCHWFFLL